MIVTLNGQRIDVTLERERTLGEFLNGIEGWLEKSSYSLSGFSVNGGDVSPEGVEEACAMDLGEVERIDLRASSWTELLRDAISITRAVLEEALGERRAAREAGRRSDAEAIAERYRQSPACSFLALGMADLALLAEGALSGGGTDPEAALQDAVRVAEERLREVEQPRKELEAVIAAVAPMALRLEEIPLNLQTGKDAQAAATLGDFSLLCEKLFRLVASLRSDGILLEETRIGDAAFRSHIEELSAALRELTAAFENGDAILVGDLAEYEVAPRIRALETPLAAAIASSGRGA
jgi:hypothetical protein